MGGPQAAHRCDPEGDRLQEAGAASVVAGASLPTSGGTIAVHVESGSDFCKPAAPAVPAAELSIDDFMKVDLRIARIDSAELVEGADKLLRLTLDLGDRQARTSSPASARPTSPTQLVGRLTVVVANLAPRKMRFGVSEGMVLAAGPGGAGHLPAVPGHGRQPGMKVK